MTTEDIRTILQEKKLWKNRNIYFVCRLESDNKQYIVNDTEEGIYLIPLADKAIEKENITILDPNLIKSAMVLTPKKGNITINIITKDYKEYNILLDDAEDYKQEDIIKLFAKEINASFIERLDNVYVSEEEKTLSNIKDVLDKINKIEKSNYRFRIFKITMAFIAFVVFSTMIFLYRVTIIKAFSHDIPLYHILLFIAFIISVGVVGVVVTIKQDSKEKDKMAPGPNRVTYDYNEENKENKNN